jgi:FKBP-type peptidyl-prolyl cis-trans isomerase FklB
MKNIALKVLHVGALLAVAQFAAAPLVAQNPQNPPKAPPGSPTVAPGADPAPAPSPDQIGYVFGLTFGTQMHNAGIGNEVSVEAIARGVQDGLSGKSTTPADQQQVLNFVRGIHDKQVSRNEAAAKSFMERNGKDKSVVTTASGLQYKVIAPGDKKAPAINATDEVTVDYRGKLLDGSEFDSSYSRGVPTSFPVNGVIKGWQEALVLMKPGAKWTLFIPPDLAYGSTPQPKIPAGSLLIFDVTMISAKSAAAPAPAFTPRPTPH